MFDFLFKMTKKEEIKDSLDNAKGSIGQALRLLEAHNFHDALSMVDCAEMYIKRAGYSPENVDIEEVVNEILPPIGISNTKVLRKYICNQAAAAASDGLWRADGPININKWELQLAKLEDVEFFVKSGELDISDYIPDYVGICNMIFRAKLAVKVGWLRHAVKQLIATAETLGDADILHDVADISDIVKRLNKKLQP